MVGRIFNLHHATSEDFAQIDTVLKLESNPGFPRYSGAVQDYVMRTVDGTLTACLKIYAVETSTLNCVLVGISLLNIFVGDDQKQPKSISQSPIYLNSGRYFIVCVFFFTIFGLIYFKKPK